MIVRTLTSKIIALAQKFQVIILKPASGSVVRYSNFYGCRHPISRFDISANVRVLQQLDAKLGTKFDTKVLKFSALPNKPKI